MAKVAQGMAAFACAHRGLSAEKAENTLAAFASAVAAGFPAIEMDLRATADGEVVVLHDAGIERTTDGVGRIDSMAWRELQDYQTPDGPIPRLEDLFSTLQGWDGLWNLEIKAREATAPTVELVRRHGLGSRVLLTSMDAKVLHEARDTAPEIPRGSIPLGPLDGSDLATAAGTECSWVNADHDFLDGETMALLRDGGFHVGCWTVNEAPRALEVAQMGVRCVITDVRQVGQALRRPASWR